MGRDSTPEERAEDCKRRKQTYERLSKLIGIPIDEILATEAKARTELKKVSENSTISDSEFAVFVEAQCNRFSEESTKNEFRRFAVAKRKNFADDILTLEQKLTFTADAMLKSEQFNKKNRQ